MNYRLDIQTLVNGRYGYTQTWVVTAADPQEAARKAPKLAGTRFVLVTVTEQPNDDSFDNGCQ